MPLQKQIVPVPVDSGLMDKTDPKQLEPGQAAILENLTYNSFKQLSQIQGFTKLATTKVSGGNISASDYPLALYSADSALVIRASDRFFSYSEDNSGKWAQKDCPPMFRYTKRVLQAGEFPYENHAYDTDGTYEVLSFYTKSQIGGGDGVKFEVRDVSTGAVLAEKLVEHAFLASNIGLGAVIISNTAYFFYCKGAVFSYYSVPLSTLTFSSETTIASGILGDFSYTKIRDSVFITGINDPKTSVNKLTHPWGASFNATTNVFSGATSDKAYIGSYDGGSDANDRLWVAFRGTSSGNAIFYTVLDGTLSTIVTTQTISGTAYSDVYFAMGYNTTTSRMHIYYSGVETTSPKAITLPMRAIQVTNAGAQTALTLGSPPFAAKAAFHPMFLNGRSYEVCYDVVSQNYEMSTAPTYQENTTLSYFEYPVSFWGFGLLYPNRNFRGNTASTFLATGMETITAVAPNVSPYYPERQIVRYEIEQLPYQVGSSVSHSGTTYFPGASVTGFDGKAWFDLGFQEVPEIGTPVASGGAGSLTGTYQITVTFEWYDAKGNLHQSAAAVPQSVSATSNTTITTPVYLPSGTSKNQPIQVSVWRTVANGTTFYLTARDYISWDSGTSSPKNIASTTTDALIISNPILYTTGGIIESGPTPAMNDLIKHNRRIIGIDAEDTNKLFYSKTLQDKTAPQFNEDLFLRCDDGFGGALKIASLDEKLVILKKKDIFVIFGSGPNDLGTNSDFSDPQRVQTDQGISEPASLVKFPEGLLFKSTEGWKVLTRQLTVIDAGISVDRLNSLTVSSAVLIEDQNQIRITHTEGTTIIFDYLTKKWTTVTNQAAIGSANFNGKHVFLKSDGSVLLETSGQWLMDTSVVEPRLTTGWINLPALQGFSRVYKALVLGEKRGAHQVRIRIGYDFDPNWRDEFTIDSTTAIGATNLTDSSYYTGGAVIQSGAPAKTLQYEVRPSIQKCESIRFEITLLNSGAVNNELARISGLALVVGMKTKTYRLDSSRVIP